MIHPSSLHFKTGAVPPFGPHFARNASVTFIFSLICSPMHPIPIHCTTALSAPPLTPTTPIPIHCTTALSAPPLTPTTPIPIHCTTALICSPTHPHHSHPHPLHNNPHLLPHSPPPLPPHSLHNCPQLFSHSPLSTPIPIHCTTTLIYSHTHPHHSHTHPLYNCPHLLSQSPLPTSIHFHLLHNPPTLIPILQSHPPSLYVHSPITTKMIFYLV